MTAQNAVRRASIGSACSSTGIHPGAAAPKTLMKTSAMMPTQTKISTLIAEPRPTLKPLNRLS